MYDARFISPHTIEADQTHVGEAITYIITNKHLLPENARKTNSGRFLNSYG